MQSMLQLHDEHKDMAELLIADLSAMQQLKSASELTSLACICVPLYVLADAALAAFNVAASEC